MNNLKALEQLLNPSAIQRELASRSYYEFLKLAWKVLEPQTPFVDNWHIKYLCDKLQKEVERISRNEPKSKDLIINIPPRSLKSGICTIYLNAWAWIKYPHLKFITSSYSQNLSTQHAIRTRRLIESEWYQSLFSSFSMAGDQNVKSMFENDKTGARFSTSVGGSLTGSGCDIFIADDPHKADEVHSEVSREAVIDWWRNTAFTRLNQQQVGLRLIVMQRLHEADLTGAMLETGKYDHICIPAEITDKTTTEVVPYYQDGLFFPSIFNREVLRDLQESMKTNYAGQYLQQPVIDGGEILRPIAFYETVDLARCDFFGYIDLAISEKETADYTCIVTIARDRDDGKMYVVEPTRIRGNVHEQMDLVFSMYAKYKWRTFGVESVAYQKAFYQWLLKESQERGIYIPVREIQLDKDKVRRAMEITPHVDNGTILFNNSYQDFMAEIMQFPKSSHDDYVDAFIGAVKLALEGTTSGKIITGKGIVYPK